MYIEFSLGTGYHICTGIHSSLCTRRLYALFSRFFAFHCFLQGRTPQLDILQLADQLRSWRRADWKDRGDILVWVGQSRRVQVRVRVRFDRGIRFPFCLRYVASSPLLCHSGWSLGRIHCMHFIRRWRVWIRRGGFVEWRVKRRKTSLRGSRGSEV